MAKNSAGNITLPSTQKDRQIIKNAIIEGANSLVRIDSEKDNIKAICDSLKEDYELPPSYVKQLIKTYHKQNFSEVTSKAETFEELYEELLGANPNQDISTP